MLWNVLFPACLLGAAPSVEKAPSLAVLNLVAKGGVEQVSVDLVTASLVSELRKAGVFSSVVALRELETAMGFEQVKLLMDCSQSSCLAEIAGSLGVDMIVTGDVGRLGGSYVLSCALIETRTARTVGAATQRLPAASVEVLLDAVSTIVGSLVVTLKGPQGSSGPKPPAGSAPPVSSAVPATIAPTPSPLPKDQTPSPATAPSVSEGSNPWPWRALAASGAVGALAILPVTLVAMVVVYFSVGVLTRVYVLKVPYAGDAAGGVAALMPLVLGISVATAGWAVAALATWRSLS